MRCRTDLLWIRSVAAVAVCFFLSAGVGTGQQAAGIMGQVTDENGGVLPGVTVSATSPALQVGSVADVTNDRGEYRFYWLPPGQYYLAVVPEDTRRRQVVSVQPPPGTGGHREDTAPPVITRRIAPDGTVVEETYVAVYYPGDTDSQRAVPIAVTENVAGVPAELVELEGGERIVGAPFMVTPTIALVRLAAPLAIVTKNAAPRRIQLLRRNANSRDSHESSSLRERNSGRR